MAIVLESVTQTLVGANDSTPTWDMPATRPDNDLYVLCAGCDGAITNLIHASWTFFNTSIADEGTVGARVRYRLGSSEPASYTGTGDSEEYVFHVLRISGINTLDPIGNNTGAIATGNSATATAGTMTPDTSGGMAFRLWAIDTDNPTGSAPANHDNFNGASSSAGGAGSAYSGIARVTALTTASVALGTATMGGTYDDNWAAVTFYIKASTAAPTFAFPFESQQPRNIQQLLARGF